VNFKPQILHVFENFGSFLSLPTNFGLSFGIEIFGLITQQQELSYNGLINNVSSALNTKE